MHDKDNTKETLVRELEKFHQHNANLEASKNEHKRVEEKVRNNIMGVYCSGLDKNLSFSHN